ncbi:hypothetical protein CsSME_00011664 [Camellia sinensis var. sinensis]
MANVHEVVMRLVVALHVVTLLSGPICIFGKQSQSALRFDRNGEFRILQVADMHYADGKTTPCKDVLPEQVPGCSDLNTTAFLKRMILAFHPHLIVFTGTPPVSPSLFLSQPYP